MIRELIPWARPDYWGREREYVAQALESTWISGGPFVERLEAEFAGYCRAPFAVSACNGTAALHMALLALGVGPGDEVIVPGFGFMAVANVALHLGARPVFADVDPDTWCVTANEIDKRIRRETKVVVPVHTYGNVCDMGPILSLATDRDLPVVEDVAEAFASTYDGHKAGTLGRLGTFSLHATKTITSGEGGMVTTGDSELHDRLELFRSHGMRRSRRWYWHEVVGHNFRLTNLQAAIACAQLEQIEKILVARRRVHEAYRRLLEDVDGIGLQRFLPSVEPVLWALGLKLDPAAYPQGRDEVLRQLRDASIESRPGFYAASSMPHLYESDATPVSEQLSACILSLPSFATLTESDIEYICATLKGLRA